MIHINPGLYVRVCQLDTARAPQPLPLDSGFSPQRAYKVLGVHAPSETAEAYLVLSNDDDQLWFISNRHLRTHAVLPDCEALRFDLAPPHVRAA